MTDDRDKEGQPQGFKVSDRRKRYEEPAAAEPAPPAAEPDPAPAVAQDIADAGGPDQEPHAEPGLPGPADFVQLIGKLYQDGLAFMGLFDDPKSGQSMANFPIASWHIDVLGILEQKTKGNLTDEEAKLLTDAIANLKVTFVRATGYIKH